MTSRVFKSNGVRGNCSPPGRRKKRLSSYEAIVAQYLAKHSDIEDEALQFFRDQSSFADALKHAALASLNGKRADHQRRLPASVLKKAWNTLKRRDLQSCKTFHELFSLVDATVRPINGIGELYVYDTALRIGAYLGLQPDRVYLHAGTRVGACHLGFSGRKFVLVSELPKAFAVLSPGEAEDCLCIFKRALARLRGA